MSAEPKRRGRPLKPPQLRKRYALGIRVTAEVKEAIEDAARVAGRSQAQECELRLEWAVTLKDRLDRIEEAIVGLARVLGIRDAA